MGRTWKGRLAAMDGSPTTLAESLALQLRSLHDEYSGEGGQPDDPIALYIHPATQPGQTNTDAIRQARQSSIQSSTMRVASQNGPYRSHHAPVHGSITTRNTEIFTNVRPEAMAGENADPQAGANEAAHQGLDLGLDHMSVGLMDQDFLHTDRVINYDDFVFNAEPWASGNIPDL